jgi:hypothetical protein
MMRALQRKTGLSRNALIKAAVNSFHLEVVPSEVPPVAEEPDETP